MTIKNTATDGFLGGFMLYWIHKQILEKVGVADMVSQKIYVKNPIGVHLRPAGAMAEAAIQFKNCDITLASGGRRVNGKSLLSILSLGIKQHMTFEIICSGEGEEEALEAMVHSLGDDL